MKPSVLLLASLLLQNLHRCSPLQPSVSSNDWNNNNKKQGSAARSTRRGFIETSILGFASTFLPLDSASASVFSSRGRRSSSYSYILSPDGNVTDSLATSEKSITVDPEELSAEQCLLKLLPVRSPFFRELEESLEQIPPLLRIDGNWKACAKIVEESCLNELDKRRSILEPVFNPEDNSLMQISKAERGEQLVERFRSRLVDLLDECVRGNDSTKAVVLQRKALLALSEIGELLVAAYPYQVPTEEKFSYLPRLLGRAKVTFSIARGNTMLGNITIVADGYMAPVTAGNFVDLSMRNFYTQLPIKFTKRRLGKGDDFDVANLPILGSYQEGFFDPLTAKLRRLPLELIRVEKGNGVPNLAYTQQNEKEGIFSSRGAVLEPTVNSKPLLSFQIQGLVAMNHPDKNLNGASSEFFALQRSSIVDEKRAYLDGEYAPFGFIIEGLDILEQLKSNDRIAETFVDEWGQLNLVKLRRSSFSEVLEGAESE
jgi:peptidylprolyl isomerase